jgi:hypothetical protein
MLRGSCHCGTLKIGIPHAPAQLTNCNCSICRRLGALWCYFPVSEVELDLPEGSTDEYIQGDRTLRTVRCKRCGCVTHWSPLVVRPDSTMGVNARMFDPQDMGAARIRLFDGADTWRFIDD